MCARSFSGKGFSWQQKKPLLLIQSPDIMLGFPFSADLHDDVSRPHCSFFLFLQPRALSLQIGFLFLNNP
jgi:hypothetical protein